MHCKNKWWELQLGGEVSLDSLMMATKKSSNNHYLVTVSVYTWIGGEAVSLKVGLEKRKQNYIGFW